jgi:hypothetical protein
MIVVPARPASDVQVAQSHIVTSMEVRITKLSDARHRLEVSRDDGSTERVELDSRSFLNHDLAHLAVEAELGLQLGFWGSVARGASLTGVGLKGNDITVAERLAGPVQSLIRVDAGPAEIQAALEAVAPNVVDQRTGAGIHERLRRLLGQWRATPYRGEMVVTWPLGPVDEATQHTSE